MRWVIAIIAAAVAADLALRRIPWNNVAFAMLIIVVAVGLLASGFVRTRSTRAMLGLAVLFAGFIVWRTGDLLTTFNFLTAGGLLLGASAFGRRGDIWNVGPIRLTGNALSAIEQSVLTPVAGVQEVGARYRAWQDTGNEHTRALLRGAAIAVPVVLVLGVLLASADVVFQSFFTGIYLPIDTLFGHVLLASVGGLAMATLLRMAGQDDELDLGPTTMRLGHIEAVVLLGAMTALFAGFAVAQLLTVLGGADEALARAGLEPKQFARQGFFQLLWVAGITLAIVMIVRVLTSFSDKGRTAIKILGLITVALTMVIVSVALVRIFYYIGDSGLTPKRLYALVITSWIAMCFVLLATRLTGFRSAKDWLTPASVVAAVIVLATLNLANPQRRIAEDNLARDQDVVEWHVRHGQFVGDGRATLADNLDRLSPELAPRVEVALCENYGAQAVAAADDGFLSFNVGRSKADNAIVRLCGS